MLDDLFNTYQVPEAGGTPIPKTEPVARPIDDPITRAAIKKAKEQKVRHGYQYKLSMKLRRMFGD